MENNWIEHAGDECPVAQGTLVDVTYRDNEIKTKLPALLSAPGRDASWPFWQNDDQSNDIIWWRRHKPEQSLDEAIGQQSYPEDFTVQQELTYPQTNFKPSSEAQLRADEAARVNALLSEKLSTIADTFNKITGKNFSVADIKLVKSLLLSVEEYEENR